MNEDFSEVISKFKNILAEKNVDIPENFSQMNNSSEKSPSFDFDITTILKIKSMIGAAQDKNLPRMQLLNALKPFLHKQKQEKLEEYIKLANMLTVLEILGENRR